jgi:hypothetical protein
VVSPSAEDGIAVLKLAERIAAGQLSPEHPSVYVIPGVAW